ncbi:MAG: hypothetical protein ABR936_05580 [Bacteroidota bacterium]|jgi:hypothetical protein
MNKFTHAFWFLTFAIILLCFISAFSPPSIDVDSSTKVDNKLKPLRIPTGRTDTEFEILLGQAKYYQAITNRNQLVIVESTKPELQGGASDVTFEVVKVSRDTLGVYYDNKDEQGNDLPLGMIRLIGVYWDGGEPFKVRLTAKKRSFPIIAEIGYTLSQLAEMRESYEAASVVVDVKAPYSLGTASNTVTDCFGNSIDIDELIIKFAGENGIPPQLIKGQMEKESSFKPKWRYEPFQDAQKTIKDKIFNNNKFVITDNSMGSSFPPSHSNSSVYPTFYIQSQIKISRYLYDNWENRYVRYGETDNDPDLILGSKNLNDQWNAEWKKIKDKVKNPKDSAHTFVKSLIMDTSTTFGKGFDRLAQTRIVTSYGFIQMMYTTAITDGKFNAETEGRYGPTDTQYMDKTNSSKYPEMLNEQNILMPRYCDFLLGKLHLLFNSSIPESQWKITNRKIKINGKICTFNCNGFEECWKNAIQLYNFYEPGYGNDVWNRAQNYLPK